MPEETVPSIHGLITCPSAAKRRKARQGSHRGKAAPGLDAKHAGISHVPQRRGVYISGSAACGRAACGSAVQPLSLLLAST